MSIYVRKRGGLGSNPLFTIGFTFLLGIAIGFSLCYAWLGGKTAPAPAASTVAKAPADADAPKPAEKPATVKSAPSEAVLADLNPARHLFVSVEGTTLSPEYADFLRQVKPGGIVLREENVQSAEQSSKLSLALKEAEGFGTSAADWPLVAAIPERLEKPLGLPELPAPTVLGSRRDTSAARDAGKALADRCKSFGIQVVMSPWLIQAPAEGASDRTVYRYAFGTDSGTVVALGLAFADGLLTNGVIPVARPYPALRTESAQATVPTAAHDLKALAQVMLPFTEAADYGVPGILAGAVAVPALDTRYPERPAELSPVVVNGVLRAGRRHYEGVILADDLKADPVSGRYSAEDAAVEALAAGCDAVVISEADPERIRAICAAIARAVQEGILPRERLAASKTRLEGWQERLRNPEPLPGPLPDVTPLRTQVAESAAPGSPAAETPAVETTAPAAPETSAAPAAPEATPAAPETTPTEPAAAPSAPPTSGLLPTEAATRTAVPPNATPAQPETPPAPAEAPAAPATPPAVDTTASASPDTGAAAPEEANANPEADAEPAPAEGSTAEPATQPETPAAAESAEVAIPDGAEKVVYEIQPGDRLFRIAQRYGVSVQDVVRWNKLESEEIKWGRKLTIYTKQKPASAEAPAAPVVAETPAPAPAPEAPAPAPEATVEAAAPAPAAPEAAAETPAAPAETAAPTEPAETAETAAAEPADDTEALAANEVEIHYEVLRGDTLANVAGKFGVKQSDVVKWNRLSNTNLKWGRKLKLHVLPEVAARYGQDGKAEPVKPSEPAPEATPVEAAPATPQPAPEPAPEPAPAAPAVEATPEPAPATASAPAPAVSGEMDTHVVVVGDTATRLAREHGISVSELLRINGIDNADHIMIGQKLKVPRR